MVVKDQPFLLVNSDWSSQNKFNWGHPYQNAHLIKFCALEKLEVFQRFLEIQPSFAVIEIYIRESLHRFNQKR